MFKFGWRATYFRSLRAKLNYDYKFIEAPLQMPKWVWPSMNQYRISFIQTSTLPPSMHREHTQHGRSWIQNNQLPTKSHVELEDAHIEVQFWIFKNLGKWPILEICRALKSMSQILLLFLGHWSSKSSEFGQASNLLNNLQNGSGCRVFQSRNLRLHALPKT